MTSSNEQSQTCVHISLAKKSVLSALILLVAACGPEKETAPEQKPVAIKSEPKVTVVAKAEVSNPSEFARDKSPLYFSYYDLGIAQNSTEASTLAVKVGQTIVPSQAIDKNADGNMDGIAIALDLKPADVVNLDIVADEAASKTTFTKLTQAEISHKEGGKWVPHTRTEGFQEYVGGTFKNVQKLTPPKHYTDHSNWIRYEGPGIESDKVGYRIYLDWRNGYDIFGKKVETPVMQLVGQDGYESYHNMQDWGMDILKVGKSLGAGGFGYWDGKQVQIISEVDEWTATITNNGAIYSSVNIFYDNWKVQENTIDITSEVSMVAGSRLGHNELTFSNEPPALTIGVVKHKETEFVSGDMTVPGDSYTYIGSWGNQALSKDGLGMAVLVRRSMLKEVVEDKSSYAALVSAKGNELDYYFVAAWQGEHNNGIASKEAFVKYLEQEVEKLNQPPRIRLKTALSIDAKKGELTANKALGWSKKLADSELKRKTLKYFAGGWDTNRKRKPKFEYDIIGLQPLAYDELSKETGEQAHKDVLDKVTATYIEDDGNILYYKESNYNIDSVAPGMAVLKLYKRNKDEKYKLAAQRLAKQLENHPKTSEGAFWHKKRYPWQIWLDGVYMGMPFLAEYTTLFEEGKHLEEVVNEFKITRKYLRNPTTGLYYHAWDEKKQQDWADPKTGLSPNYWARGFGWLTMAVVDVLDYIPTNNTELRQPLLDIIKETAETLVKYQDPETKTWWQIMDKPGKAGNYRESTASAMFTYFFAKAVRNGYLPESYKQVAIDSYKGLINEFVTVHKDGTISMTNQCLVAGLGFGRDGSYKYYMTERVFKNDPKGNGPFILAGVEIYRIMK